MLESSVYETAFAKLNLHLQVGEKRQDGFHNIGSIFQTISLCDFVFVKYSEKFSVNCLNFNLPAENSLVLAYKAFCEKTDFNKPVEVSVLKEIPSCAGLGGASTDAVALLKGLNRLSGKNLSVKDLEELAIKVGSDCPFFVQGGTAFVSGRGEVLEKLQARDCKGLLIFPKTEVKTFSAYKKLDELRVLDKNCFLDMSKKQAFIKKYKTEDFSEWGKTTEKGLFVNDFEKVVFPEFTEISEVKNALIKTGADFALMTGSGSAVFGLFNKVETLKKAHKKLKKRFDFCQPFLFV